MRKSIIPFLIVMAIIIYMFDFGKGEIEYQYVALASLPKKYFSGLTKDSGGMLEYNNHTYAFITTALDEKVEIEFVGKAEDGIGKEVKYRVVKNENMSAENVVDGKYAVWIIKLEKKVSTPFGFNNVDL